MSEFHFALGRASVPTPLAARIARIARRHGATFVSFAPGEAGVPGNRTRYWFSTENLGEPFNAQTRNAVLSDLAAAGIELP